MRRILLFSDGTGNSSAKAQKTNVWRLFQAADLTDIQQIAYYDDGVGTSSNKYLAMLGGAFGWGLKRNVLDIYKFLCMNYQPGDQIFGFGFSRGAYTIRLLVGMIVNQGLLHPMGSEELDRYARAAYRSYRAERISPDNPIFRVGRSIRDFFLRCSDKLRDLPPYETRKNRSAIRIRFLGLWDTVGAYELPINALKRAVGMALWPMEFADRALSTSVDAACHALSLDDERQTFHPVLFDETAESILVAQGKVPPGRLKQVWFPGVHCNVGGGYPEDRLSLNPLHWIMSEAAAAKMRLIPAAIEKVVAQRSPYARIYNSRAGFASFYRYSPREIRIWEDANGKKIDPVVDSSVILRMADGTDRYAPIPLPGRFWVLEESGALKAMFGTPDGIAPNVAIPVFPPVSRLGIIPIAGVAPQLAAAVARFLPLPPIVLPSPQALEVVANTIWWRRVAYWIQFLFAALLALFPAYKPASYCDTHYCDGSAAALSGITGDALGRIIDTLKGVLPSVSTRWTDAFGADPDLFALFAIGLLLSFYLSNVLKLRISERARMAWHTNFQPVYHAWCVRSARASSRVAGAMLVPVAVLTVLCAAFEPVTPEHGVSIPGISTLFTRTTVQLAVASLALLLLSLWRVYRLRKLEAMPAIAGAGPVPTTFTLALANRARNSVLLVKLYQCVCVDIIPMTCVVLFIGFAGLAINRALFDAELASGLLCNAERANSAQSPSKFETRDFCWSSGITLQKDATYLLTLKTPGNWFDANERGDVGGFPTDTSKHYEATLLKRNWSEWWFKPIARIGETGSDEYILEPINPFAPHGYANGLLHEAPSSRAAVSPASASKAVAEDPTPADRMIFSAKITAHKAGKLFLYVNDAVLAIPFLNGYFYSNNFGDAEVTVDRLRPDGTLCRMNLDKGGTLPRKFENCTPFGKEAGTEIIRSSSDMQVQR